MQSINIDLRSDTVTKPSKLMLNAMMAAEVGDDVFKDDPTVNNLEKRVANLFGMESALFCPSGTMTNQLAIKVHCPPGSEVICHEESHIYLYEGGGIALNAQSSVRTLPGERGRIKAYQIADSINDLNDIHKPISRMVGIENTMNKGGGSIYDFREIVKIREACNQNNLILHLDGARLFNALVETKETPADYGRVFDSISICMSKGLGCPVGSLLLGTDPFIDKAKRFRKAMGGGWRQAGFLAAAALFALDNNVERLKEDHYRAKQLGEMLKIQSYVKNIYPIETNIVIFELPTTILATDFVATLAQHGLRCVPFGKHLVRFVTHLDFTDAHLEKVDKILGKVCL
ncbi:MAG: GntG family PLP-dependent aldolase [Salinivirgaceae bacterium]|nr:GntG family PLP-dependent aldolase [Salinivirgaceae bacterium]